MGHISDFSRNAVSSDRPFFRCCPGCCQLQQFSTNRRPINSPLSLTVRHRCLHGDKFKIMTPNGCPPTVVWIPISCPRWFRNGIHRQSSAVNLIYSAEVIDPPWLPLGSTVCRMVTIGPDMCDWRMDMVTIKYKTLTKWLSFSRQVP